MFCKAVLSILFLIFIQSCDKKNPTIEEQFNLPNFSKEKYDLYNPILNSFKIDSTARKKHPDFYKFDAYFDKNNSLQYFLYKFGSYGYLAELSYSEGKIQRICYYPVLAGELDKNAESVYTDY